MAERPLPERPLPERRSVSPRVVFGVLLGSLFLALGFGVFVYYRFIRYEPQAAAFLPPQAEATIWIQMEQGVVYEPFRRHFFPLLERGREGPESRLKHFERKTTVELGVDSRELALAFWGSNGFGLVLGGLFRPDKITQGAVRLLQEEGRERAELEASGVARLGPRVYFAAHPRGLLLLGNDPSWVGRPQKGRASSDRADALRVRFGPSAEAPGLDFRVDVAADFPFEARLAAEYGPFPRFVAENRGALHGDHRALMTALLEAQEVQAGVYRGVLGRQGFDDLLAEIAAELALRAGPAFDP